MKKALIIFMALILVIFTVNVKPKPAHAIAPAIPLAATGATGAYALGALAIAGLAGAGVAVGVDKSEEIQAAATRAWERSSDKVKSDFETAVKQANMVGAASLTLGESFYNYFEDIFAPEVAINYSLPSFDIPFNGNLGSLPFMKKYEKVLGSPVEEAFRDYFTSSSFYYFSRENAVFQVNPIRFKHDPSTVYNYVTYKKGSSSYFVSSTGKITYVSSYGIKAGDSLLDLSKYEGSIMSIAGNPTVPKGVDTYADQVGKGVEKVLERSKKQGLKVPNGAILGGLAVGGGILYNPLTEQWENDQTGEVYQGDLNLVDWKPAPLTVETNPDGTVVTDTSDYPVVSTPPYSIPTVGNPAIPAVDVPATNIVTGNPVPSTPTVPPAPSPGKINFPKLKISLAGITKAFPFSIPWDIGRAFDAVFGSIGSEKPVWELPIGKEVFTIKMPDMIYNWLPFLHGFLLITFDLGLVYAIRKWFGGAS